MFKKGTFTGIKDLDGREIDVGDIVEHTNHIGLRGERTEIKEVVWDSYEDGEYVYDVQCFMIGNDPLSDVAYRMNNLKGIDKIKVVKKWNE